MIAQEERSRSFGCEVSFLFRPENIRNRRGGLREGGAIILPQQRGDRGGDLTLRDRFRTRAFSEGGCVGADHGNPDALGAFDLVAVVGPGFPGAAAVVGGDDESRFVPVLGMAWRVSREFSRSDPRSFGRLQI